MMRCGSTPKECHIFVTWWIREIYQFCINLLTTTDFTMWGQISPGENRPPMCIETHILNKQTVIQSCRGVLAYICWEREIQTDDVDGIVKHDTVVVLNVCLDPLLWPLGPQGPCEQCKSFMSAWYIKHCLFSWQRTHSCHLFQILVCVHDKHNDLCYLCTAGIIEFSTTQWCRLALEVQYKVTWG